MLWVLLAVHLESVQSQVLLLEPQQLSQFDHDLQAEEVLH